MNYQALLNSTYDKIKNLNITKELICYHAKLSREQLLRVMEDKVKFNLKIYNENVNRYISGTPIQHITGITHFRGITIELNNCNAFIPRYETEQLIDHISEYKKQIFGNKMVDIADIGTGSGVIPISLRKELSISNIYAVEINPNSIPIAKNNFKKHNTKVILFEGDALQPLINNNIKVDILISNPPYIPLKRNLDKRVKAHEPQLALFSGNDGLNMFRKLFKDANKILNDTYLICFEHDDSQTKGLTDLISKYFPNSSYRFIKDLAEKPRFLIIWKY